MLNIVSTSSPNFIGQETFETICIISNNSKFISVKTKFLCAKLCINIILLWLSNLNNKDFIMV